MTSKNEMSQSADTAGDKQPDADTKGSKQDTKSTAHTGAKSSASKKPEKKSGLLPRMILTILLAFFVLTVYAYFYMPDKFNQYLSFNDTSEAVNEQGVSGDATNPDFVPAAPVANYAMNNQSQHDDWAAQQRAEFEKRRAEFQNRNSENYAHQRQSMSPAEPPQWVKDRQAEMEKQRAQYMKDMAEQQARWEENMKRNQMQMNPYQQYPANSQPYNAQQAPMPNQYNQQPPMPYQQPAMPYQQNQQYNPANQPPPPQYYNRPPAYNYGPNYAPNYPPYGWQGNGYR